MELSNRAVKIRKPRRCYGCDVLHEAGSTMHYAVGVYDGDFWHDYFCPPCNELRYRPYYGRIVGCPDDGLAPGEFGERAKELGFDTTAELLKHFKATPKPPL